MFDPLKAQLHIQRRTNVFRWDLACHVSGYQLRRGYWKLVGISKVRRSSLEAKMTANIKTQGHLQRKNALVERATLLTLANLPPGRHARTRESL